MTNLRTDEENEHFEGKLADSEDYKTDCRHSYNADDVDKINIYGSENQTFFEDPLIEIKFEHPVVGQSMPNDLTTSSSTDAEENLEDFGTSSLKGMLSTKYFVNKKVQKPIRQILKLKCEVCTRKFSSFVKKEYHLKVCHDLNGTKDNNRMVICKHGDCTAYFMGKVQLKHHYKLEHKEKSDANGGKANEKKRLKCLTCGKRFAYRTGFQIHFEYHKDPSEWKWKCKTCERKCVTEHKLREHMRTHTRVKPYHCRFCGDNFRCVETINRHFLKSYGDEKEVMA